MSNQASPVILVVDDTPTSVRLIQSILGAHGMRVLAAEDGLMGLHLARSESVDLILMDVIMPNMDGFEACHRLKSDPRTRDIPVIFMTALTDAESKISAFQAGGVDYLVRPVHEEDLLARVNIHLGLHRLQQEMADKNRQLQDKNRQLQYALQQHQAVLDNSLVGIAFLDAERRILEANDQTAAIFGYAKQDILGKTSEMLYPSAADYAQMGADAYPRLNAGEPYETERLMRRRDGSRFWCLLRGKAIEANNLSRGTVWNLDDIDARKTAADDLRLAATVFDSVGEALLVCDPASRIVRVNRAFSALTGYAPEEVLGRSPSMFSSGRHNQAFYQSLWDNLLQDGQWQGEMWDRRKDGSLFPVLNTISAVRRPDGGISHYVAVMADISAHKRAEAELSYQANYDRLTGLPNRGMFHDRLRQALARAQRHGTQLAVLYADLDGFKQINDILGHEAGDRVLVSVAERLREALRDEDTAARLGGDEFAVLLADLEQIERVDTVAKRVLDRLNLSVESAGQQLPVSASLGIALYPEDGRDEAELLRQADAAMYRAKQLGKNTYCRVKTRVPSGAWRPRGETPPLRIHARGEERQRLLYIEDNPLDALMAQSVLESEGYAVDVVASGMEGRQRLHDGRYALALIDYQLPDMDGMALLEYVREEHLPLPVIMLTAQEDIGVAVEAMKQGAADYVRKDQDLIGLLPAVVARTLTSGRIRQLQQEARQAQEERALYRSIFDTAFLALIVFDQDGKVVEVNDTACALFGYRRDEFVQLHGYALCRAEDYGVFKRFLDSEAAFPHCEAATLSRTGEERHIELQRSLIVYQGRPHLLALIRDISARKQSEARLRQAAIVFEHASEGIIITDALGRILAVNRGFTAITGYLETEVLGLTPSVLQSGRHDHAFYQTLWASLETAGFWRGEIWNRRKNGELFVAWQEISRVCEENRAVQGYISIFSDVTSQKTSEEKIRRLLHYDVLTDLPNRLLFVESLEQALPKAGRGGNPLAVLYLGLDGFKGVNESLGVSAGDRLLQTCARRLREELAETIYLGRIAGDEFACFVELERAHSTHQVTALTTQILGLLARPFAFDSQLLHLTGSLGVSLYPRDGEDANALLKHADTAMSRAKQQGRNTYRFYAEELTALAQERLNLESALREAVAALGGGPVAAEDPDHGFYLHYQPQVELESGHIVCAEVLLRWRHPQLGQVPPDRFIPVAEECGLILALDEWVLRGACRQMRAWLDQGLALHAIAANLSALQVRRDDLLPMVERTLRETGLPAHYLELEITEGLFIGEVERAGTLFEELRALGVRLAIDDFGSGYSSLSYLEHLRVDKLKLDRSLLKGVGEGTERGKVAAAAIALGRALQLKVLCEGVETRVQESFLKAHQCHEAQGFLYSRPVPAGAFAALVKRCLGGPDGRNPAAPC